MAPRTSQHNRRAADRGCEGALIRLFNINASKPEHQVKAWKRPYENTEPLADSEDAFLLDKRHEAISHGLHLSRGVRERETRGSINISASEASAALSAGYTCKETQGALLDLQSDGSSETVFSNRELQNYMIRQHEQWCNYVRDVLKQVVNPEDVFVVSGWVKTSADWAVAAFSNFVSKHYASVEGQAGGFVGFGLFRSRARAHSGPKMHRQGSKYPRDEGRTLAELAKDQSIFLQRYKLKRRFLVLKTIVAGAGYDRLPGPERGGHSGAGPLAAGSDRESDVDDEDVDEDGLRWVQNGIADPLDTLLDYILEVSDAETAIARDDDVQGTLGVEDWPVDFATYLRHVQPPVVVENQCGTISISELLARERIKKLERRFVTAADLHKWPHISYDGAGVPSMASAKFTDSSDSSPYFPTKWPYLEFPDPSTSDDSLTITPYAASADGKLLAAIAGTAAVVVWRLSDGLVVQRLGGQGHTGAICTLAFSPDGSSLASGSADSTIIVWSVKTGRHLLRLHGHSQEVKKMIYTTDGSLIVSTSGDAIIKFWDASSGAPLGNFHHSRRVEGFLLSQEGSKLAVRMERSVAVFEANSRGPIVRLGVVNMPNQAKVATTAFSSDGSRLFVSDNRSQARIYSTDTCKEIVQLEEHLVTGAMVSAAFSLDGAQVATVGGNDPVCIWNSRDGKARRHLPAASPVTAVAFSPDGAFLAAARGGNQSNIRVWDWQSEELVADFAAPVSNIEEIRFLPDSRSLLTFAKAGPVCLWNVADVLRLR